MPWKVNYLVQLIEVLPQNFLYKREKPENEKNLLIETVLENTKYIGCQNQSEYTGGIW